MVKITEGRAVYISEHGRDLIGHACSLTNEKMRNARENGEDTEVTALSVPFTFTELMKRCGWSGEHLDEHLDELQKWGYITLCPGDEPTYRFIDENLFIHAIVCEVNPPVNG
jgi:hypothetical protein